MSRLSILRKPLSIAAMLCAAAFANNRRFGYTYETATMPKDSKELEVWTTARMGRDAFYSRLDHRLEFETGITDNLQTAFYLNWRQITEDNGSGGLKKNPPAWRGISSEWKYKLSDPTADPLGFALYGELGYKTDEIELEAKTLFDKQAGPLLFAANLVGELVYAAGTEDMELEEIEIEADLAAAYSLTPAFSVGLELRNHNEIAKDSTEMEFEHSALFLGPTLAYGAKTWWMTFTVLPQIPAIKAPAGRGMVLDEHEALEARLLFSFHL